MLFMGGKMVLEGAITLGYARCLSALYFNDGLAMTAIGWCLSLLQRGNASMKRIDEVMDERSEIISKADATRQFVPKGRDRIQRHKFSV